MSVQRARYEVKSAALYTDFAKEFVTRRFGAELAQVIYDTVPKFSRGVHKGQPKGFVTWLKCVEGGWAGSTGNGTGRVVYPGTSGVQITVNFAEHNDSRSDSLCEGCGYRQDDPMDTRIAAARYIVLWMFDSRTEWKRRMEGLTPEMKAADAAYQQLCKRDGQARVAAELQRMKQEHPELAA
jgi:hypothetical protein